MTPEISIVMPTYNGSAFIEAAVRSLLAQSFGGWELIISDDNSTDSTRQFLAQISDPRIRIFLQERQLGIFGNLNFCISRAASPFVQILCQDDRFADENSIQTILDQWKELPREVAFLRMNFVSERTGAKGRRGALLDLQARAVPQIVRPEMSDLLFFVFGCIPGNLSNVCFRKHLVEEGGWFDQAYPWAGDFEFWSRKGRCLPWAVNSLRTVIVRDHKAQASYTLNRAGEGVPQLAAIVNVLYWNLSKDGGKSFWLRLAATSSYIALHRDIGVKLALRGRGGTYLRRVEEHFGSAAFSLGRWNSWGIYLLSLGGRIGRGWAARRALASHRSFARAMETSW